MPWIKTLSRILICLALPIALAACSDDDSTDSTSGGGNEAATAVATALANINKAQILSPVSPSSLSIQAASDWTAANLDTVSDCDSMTSAKGHMQELQDATCTISPVFDLNNLLTLVCAATDLLEVDSDGNPDVFDGSVTLTESAATTCGLDDDLVGEEMDVTVTKVSGSDDYSRKLIVNTGNTVRTMYWGKTSDSFFLSFYYEGDSAYKGFYAYENDTMLFELQSRKLNAPVDVDFFRIHMDESSNPATVTAVGSFTDLGDSDNFVRWTLQGDTNGDSDIAISMVWEQDAGSGSLDTCVDPSDFSASGSTSSCSTHTAPSVSTFDTLMGEIYTDIADNTTADDFEANFGKEDVADFTESTIVSASAVDY